MRIPTIDCVTGQGGEYFEQLKHRSQLDMREERDRVREIIEAVRGRGDEALLEYEARFDRVDLTAGTLEVTEEEIQAAYRQVGDHWLACLRQAIASIRDFHERQKKQSWDACRTWKGRGQPCHSHEARGRIRSRGPRVVSFHGADGCAAGQGSRRTGNHSVHAPAARWAGARP